MVFVITNELQIYTSSCYFLNSNDDRQCSDLFMSFEKKRRRYSFNLSVKMESLANHNQTRYFSTYLTLFLGTNGVVT